MSEDPPIDALKRLFPDTVIELTPMPGSTSADLYRVEVNGEPVVLRQFLAHRWDTPVDELCRGEATILRALAPAEVPTPDCIRLLEDRSGSVNGIVMSHLPGTVDLPGDPSAAWLDELARTLSHIHHLTIEVPYSYESWNDTRGTAPPDWWPEAELWKHLQEATVEPPEVEHRFIHRDYHPTNVLWQAGRIVGVVDWINACMGPPGVDVAHCRLNLAVMYGLAAADEFLNAYQRHRPAYRHHPFWDLEDALGALPDVKPYPPWFEFGLPPLDVATVRQRLLDFLRAALSALEER